MLKQRMQSMPRPVTLTFARACILPDEEDRPEERDQVLDMVAKRMPALGFGRAGEAAEASELRELAQRLEAELQQAREELASSREDLRAANADAVAAVEEAASLRADLADLQLSRVWGAQDARPADDDAERGPPVEGTEPQRLAAELESAARQRAALERALATAQQEEGEQRAEASASAARAAASEALLAELRAAQEELRHQARQAREELEAARAQGAEEARRCAAAVAAAEEPVRELKRMLAASQEEVAELKSREAAAKARASAAGGAAEDALADAERHRARALAAEGEAAGLRAEAELLRAAAADAEARRLEAQRRQSVAKSAAAAAAEAAEVPPAEAAVLILDELGDDVDPRVRELLARVHELEGQKSVLSRQLSERPIVYQFGPDENDPDINDEYDVEAHAPDGASRGLAALSIATICCVVLAVCWRCIMRSLVVCRRQKPTQLVEKSLRHFTRSLLKRPLLLWLFYLHVMVLWAMEGWRQAALNSAAHQSPAAQIDRAFQAAARTEAP